jgi:tetratricopeptide (TPR) repeat protein
LSEPPETRDFFISFNKADRPAATWIAWVLEKVGAHHVYFQDWDFRGNFVDHMNQGVQRCPRCVAVLSDNYFGSGFTLAEWSAYFQLDPANRASTIIPVRVGPVSEENLLAPLIYADLTDCDEATAEARLLEHVRKAIDPTFRPVPNDRPPFWRHSPKPTFPHLTKSLATHNLPPRNPDFVGRSAALQAIKAALTAPNDPPLVVTQAITGLGGVGKTQTALAFAHAQLAERRLVWWLDAEEPAKLAADYATLALPLGLPEAADQAALNAEIKKTLQASDGWLLVFDNAEERADIRPYLPTSGGGRILVTSRRTDWQGVAKTLPLDVMSEPDALRLLTGDHPEATLSADDLDEAKKLADDLGFLPLALAQARAFMSERGYGFAAYRALLAERLIEVMARGADGLDRTFGATADRAAKKRQRAVAATWDISIEAAAMAAPGARELLQLLAFFAPNPLPRSVLAADPAALPECLRDTFACEDSVAALVRFSLVDAAYGVITTHRLVQAITRESLRRRNVATAADRAARAAALLLAALPEHGAFDHRSWKHHQQHLPHHLAAARHAEALGVALPLVTVLLNETALYLMARASYGEAESVFERAGKIAKSLAPRDEIVATILNNQGALYRATNRFGLAKTCFHHAIQISEEVLGEKHPYVAVSLSNLAYLLQATGHYDEAEPLIKRAIEIIKNVRGPDDADLARALNCLAEIYRHTGRHQEAEPQYERAIAIGTTTLGLDHPDLATWLNNLALLFAETGRLAEAEPLFPRAIAIIEGALPADHPHLAMTLDNHAELLDALERWDEAEAQRAKAQAIRDARAAAGG